MNLCPFAKLPFEADTIRYVVSEVEHGSALLVDLGVELSRLATTPRENVETTLLIHPRALSDFLEYNDFLGIAEKLVDDLGLTGVIQIVGFHPRYQFAGTDPEAAENYTNRSPFSMLHLLREQSVTEVAASPEELLEIPRRNVAKLKAMGTAKLLAKLKADGILPQG
jgi:uncharacterized protein